MATARGRVCSSEQRPHPVQRGRGAEVVHPDIRRTETAGAGRSDDRVDLACGDAVDLADGSGAAGRSREVGGDVGVVPVNADDACPSPASSCAVAAPTPEEAPVMTYVRVTPDRP